MAYLGKTKNGTKAYINKKVAVADLVILVGTIEPHVHAGFGGWFKNILPGVAGVETIAQNHAICAHPKYYSLLGTEPDKNPMRRDIEEVGGMVKGAKFIINTVLNANEEIVKIVAGHPIAAHREGIKTAKTVFGVKIPSQADVVIADSFPMDIDLRQGVKAAANTLFAAKPGGIIILALKSDEGSAGVRIPKFKLNIPDEAAMFLARILSLVITKITPPGILAEERFAAYFFLKAFLRNRIYFYAPSVAKDIDGFLPSIKVFSSFDETIKAAEKEKPNADLLIFPKGGITYPIL